MRVEINVANGSGRKWIDEHHYVDMTSYATKWTVTLYFTAWKKGESASIGFYDRTYFSWHRVLPHKIAWKIAKIQLRSHVRNLNRELKKRGYDLTLEMKI
ncbi:hypothetical protein [Bacillus safensis]|uniref:hypothetical protein n=1 Tax=Bacillus safensis TaxID=561879 RepID=UPI002E20AB42|nr:hypothetical protein [Bacillus safensis]